MTIGQHINLVRGDVTIDQLAELSGVSRNTLCGWIYYGNAPHIELLILVADALNLSLDELVGRRFPK